MWISVPARSAKEKSSKKENKGMGFAHESYYGVFLGIGIKTSISMKLITFILHQIMCSLRSLSWCTQLTEVVHADYRKVVHCKLPITAACSFILNELFGQ